MSLRDLFVVILLAGGIGLTLRKPWMGVLVLAFFGYTNPHLYAWGFSRSLPVYQVILIAAFASLLWARVRQLPPSDWRIGIFYALWAWFFVTSMDAAVPWAAWPKLWDVSKVYVPLILTLLLITDREKLFWLLATIGFSFGVLALKGGIFAFATGFSYLVWGPPGSMYGGNNEFGIATLSAVPLLILVERRLKAEGRMPWLRLALIPMIPLAIASAISSWSRGTLLTLGALGVVMWWHSRHKILLGGLAAALIVNAALFLPFDWFARMETIQNFEQDASAMSRIKAWQDGIRYVIANPITGAGFDGWRFVTMRDWHSSYVEILSEHGIPGALLWCSLLVGTLLSLSRLAWQARSHPRIAWARDYAIMLRASLIAYAAGSLTLGITYWDLFYQLVFAAVLLREFVRRELKAEERTPASSSAAGAEAAG